MKHDVLVIGMGLSGLMAAKTAADHGLKTMVLAKGAGLFQVLLGAVDLLGHYPEENPEMLEDVHPGLENLIQDHPDHPYARVGLEDIENSLQSFSELFDPQGYCYTGRPGRNTLLPTGIGSLKPAYLMPSTMSAGADILSEPTLLVGFREFGNFYPAYAARSFRRLDPRNGNVPIRGESIALSDISDRKAFSPAGLATQLEEEGFRKKLAEKTRSIKKGEKRVGFPAVLGLKNAEKVKADLEERIGAKVFELPILPPSIPGMRLFEGFTDYLRVKGVRMILGFEVVSAIQKNGKCQGVVLKTPVG